MANVQKSQKNRDEIDKRPYEIMRQNIASQARLDSEGMAFDVASQIIDAIVEAGSVEEIFAANEKGPRDVREYAGQPFTLLEVAFLQSSERFREGGLGYYVVFDVATDNGERMTFSTGAPNVVSSFYRFQQLGKIGGSDPVRFKFALRESPNGNVIQVVRP